MGNSAYGTGYGCVLPKLISRYRELWSVVPGTTDPVVPFGVVTLSAGSSEGSGQHMAGMRWSQTGNYGVLPNPIMPAVFMAQGFDAGDPWEMCECRGVRHDSFTVPRPPHASGRLNEQMTRMDKPAPARVQTRERTVWSQLRSALDERFRVGPCYGRPRAGHQE